MLLSSCKWVSGVSGEMKFGILVGGLKTTYHALRPWLDLRIWKSKDFLMYNFSAADQSAASGHEDLSPSSLAQHSIFQTRSAFCFRIRAPAPIDLDDSGWFPTQGSLQLSRALASAATPPSHTHTPIHQFCLSHHPHHTSLSYNLSFAPPWPLAGSLII